jgi:hypothetical protein
MTKTLEMVVEEFEIQSAFYLAEVLIAARQQGMSIKEIAVSHYPRNCYFCILSPRPTQDMIRVNVIDSWLYFFHYDIILKISFLL